MNFTTTTNLYLESNRPLCVFWNTVSNRFHRKKDTITISLANSAADVVEGVLIEIKVRMVVGGAPVTILLARTGGDSIG
jgi:hypothetical protein